MPYCLPNDLCLILIIDLYDQGSVLQEIQMCNEEELVGVNDIIVSGFPVKTDSRYILPDCDQVQDYETKINSGFHFFVNQVISEGTMEITDTGLAELKVSATSGMSGSPILAKIGTILKYVGIYCGGPPLEGQRLLMEMLDCINNDCNEGAIMLFNQLPFQGSDLFPTCSEFENLQKEFLKCMVLRGAIQHEVLESTHIPTYMNMIDHIERFGKPDCVASNLVTLQCSIKTMLFATVKLYTDKTKLSFNSGISMNTTAFAVVKRAIEIFKTLDGVYENESDIEKRIRESLIELYPN